MALEYKVVHVGLTGTQDRHSAGLEEACNAEGAAGWRLVSTLHIASSPRFFLFFERETSA